jgi:hypothetical protein
LPIDDCNEIQPGIFFPSAKNVTLPAKSMLAVRTIDWPLITRVAPPATEREIVEDAAVYVIRANPAPDRPVIVPPAGLGILALPAVRVVLETPPT